MTSGQRAIWRNVSARYPGVSEDVSNYFWKLADEDRLEVGTPEFVRMFLAKWPDGIDVIDLSNDRPDDGPKWTTDGELIQQWTLKVGEYHRVVESIFDGEIPLPVEGNEFQLSERVHELTIEIARLNKEANKIKEELDLIRDFNANKKSSIYKMIIGVAKDKFGYVSGRNNSASSNMKSALVRQGYRLSDDTIRNFLQEAAEHLDER